MSSSISLNAHQAAETSKKNLGFWIYLMTDVLLFGSLFATFMVLRHSTFGGPSGGELFDLDFVLIETLVLLTSSFTCGLMVLALRKNKTKQVLTWLTVTFLLGLVFLSMEIYEFNHLVSNGHSWTTSAFLSAFFTLVGTHGAHILAGLIWAAVMFVRIFKRGLSVHEHRRLGLFSMFWHFLDVIWIFIFTFVYLLGGVS